MISNSLDKARRRDKGRFGLCVERKWVRINKKTDTSHWPPFWKLITLWSETNRFIFPKTRFLILRSRNHFKEISNQISMKVEREKILEFSAIQLKASVLVPAWFYRPRVQCKQWQKYQIQRKLDFQDERVGRYFENYKPCKTIILITESSNNRLIAFC